MRRLMHELKGGNSQLKGDGSRSIFRPQYEELFAKIRGMPKDKNSADRAPKWGRQFRSTVDGVCRTSLGAFLVVISVLDLRGGLW